MSPLVSVIVPVYNPGIYLEKCINSILNQSYTNLEIILVNDGSTDGSEKLCEKYAAMDSRIKVIYQSNQGVVSAKKNDVLAATGAFIGYVDSDDYIEADYFENMMKLQCEHHADIVAVGHIHEIGDRGEIKRNKIPNGDYSFADIADRVLYTGDFFEYGIGPHLYTKIFKADMLKEFQSRVPAYIMAGDDAAVVYPCLAKAKKICVSDLAGYHYVQHMGSVTKVSYGDEEKRVNILIEYLAEAMTDAGYEKQFESQLRVYRNYLLALRDISVFDSEDTLLMPYGGLSSGEKVIVYGAGVLGQKIYRYLQNDGRISITAWLDRNYESYRANGLPVESPEKLVLKELDYDDVLIANISEHTAMYIKNDLIKLGVMPDKIKWFSKEFCGLKDAVNWTGCVSSPLSLHCMYGTF